jgi:hypothetical protein
VLPALESPSDANSTVGSKICFSVILFRFLTDLSVERCEDVVLNSVFSLPVQLVVCYVFQSWLEPSSRKKVSNS